MLQQADYQRARNVTAGAVKRTPIAKTETQFRTEIKLNLPLNIFRVSRSAAAALATM